MIPEATTKVHYDLPKPASLPDLSDGEVFAKYQKRAEACARDARRTRRLYWIHQLFPWL